MPVGPPDLSRSRIAQLALTARNLDRATAFYRDRLGLRFLFAAPPGLSFFDCAGVRLMLAVPEAGAPPRHSSVVYFEVPDLWATRDTLMARGVAFKREPHRVAKLDDGELWMAFFEDSEGNLLAIMSRVRPV